MESVVGWSSSAEASSLEDVVPVVDWHIRAFITLAAVDAICVLNIPEIRTVTTTSMPVTARNIALFS